MRRYASPSKKPSVSEPTYSTPTRELPAADGAGAMTTERKPCAAADVIIERCASLSAVSALARMGTSERRAYDSQGSISNHLFSRYSVPQRGSQASSIRYAAAPRSASRTMLMKQLED